MLLAIAYGANLAGLLPGGEDADLARDARRQHPRWLRIAVLLVVAVLLFGLVAVSDRRYLRRSVGLARTSSLRPTSCSSPPHS